MSYQEDLWVVTFIHPRDPDRIRTVGPFPAEGAADEFVRRLHREWPDGETPQIGVSCVETTEPLSDLVEGDR